MTVLVLLLPLSALADAGLEAAPVPQTSLDSVLKRFGEIRLFGSATVNWRKATNYLPTSGSPLPK